MNHMITFKRVFVEKSTDLAIDTLSSGLKSIRFLPQWISDIWETFYFYGVAIIICLFLAFHISSINGLLCVWREVVDVIGSIIAILTFGSAQLDKLVSFRLRWAYVSLLTQMDNITYISRLGLEKQLNRALFGKLIPISSKVTVLYGAKGAGKTTCLNRIISDKYGVLYLSVTDVTLKEDILRDVAKLPYLKEASVVQALNAAPFTGSMIPVIVFDVELSQSNLNDASVLGLVAGLAKNFSRAARVIVVVSDANAAQMFNTDAYRREFIHVGELLEDEAAQMCVKLDDLYSLINKDDLLYVFQRIGTRPSMLVDLYDRTTTGKVG